MEPCRVRVCIVSNLMYIALFCEGLLLLCNSRHMSTDLNELVYFVRIVDAGSYSGAGRALQLPTSTLSRRVQSLEERLGARLLQRTTRTLSLTEAGRLYYESASRIVSAITDAEAAVGEMQAEPQGTLRITAPVDIGGRIWRVISEFMAKYPLVSVDLCTTERMVDLVDEAFDVAIRGGQRPSGASLVARKVADTVLGLFASPGYLERRGTPGRLSDLSQHDCVAMQALTQQGTWTFLVKGKRKSIQIRSRVLVNDFETARLAACDGLGIAQHSLTFCSADVHAGRLVEVLAGTTQSLGTLWLVYPSREHMAARTRAFIDYFSGHFEKPLATE